METQFVKGEIYSKEDIENKGFVLSKQTNNLIFYRNGDILLAFEISKTYNATTLNLLSVIID
ncbi:MAG: hypothetical protein WCL51_07510 [Bacteroidota bacterium]